MFCVEYKYIQLVVNFAMVYTCTRFVNQESKKIKLYELFFVSGVFFLFVMLLCFMIFIQFGDDVGRVFDEFDLDCLPWRRLICLVCTKKCGFFSLFCHL